MSRGCPGYGRTGRPRRACHRSPARAAEAAPGEPGDRSGRGDTAQVLGAVVLEVVADGERAEGPADQGGPTQSGGLAHAADVGRPACPVGVRVGRVGHRGGSVAAQVEGDDPETGGQVLDLPVPGQGALAEAVDEQDLRGGGVTVGRCRQGGAVGGAHRQRFAGDGLRRRGGGRRVRGSGGERLAGCGRGHSQRGSCQGSAEQRHGTAFRRVPDGRCRSRGGGAEGGAMSSAGRHKDRRRRGGVEVWSSARADRRIDARHAGGRPEGAPPALHPLARG